MDADNNTNNPPTSKNHRIVDTLNVQQNLTTAVVHDNAETDFFAIRGYADVPLLPLVKACAPLTSIIHDLSFYVELALNRTPEIPPDGLTVDESASIRLYTLQWQGTHRSLYSMLNYTLKTGHRDDLQPYFKYLKLFLTALIKLPCILPQTIWRGVTRDLSAEFPSGTVVTWRAFSSCTTTMNVLENNMFLGKTGPRTLFAIHTINARSIRAHSDFQTEDENLLLPNSRMIVQSQLNPATDLHIIHLNQIVPQEILLDPPFQGNTLMCLQKLILNSSVALFRRRTLSKKGVSFI